MEGNNEVGRLDNTVNEKQTFTREEVERIVANANNVIEGLKNTREYSMAIDKVNFMFKIIENSLYFGDETVNKAVETIKEMLFESEEVNNVGGDNGKE